MKQFVAMTLLLAAVAVAAPVTAPVASAKSLSRILAESGLSPTDFDMLQASAKTLYTAPNPKPGNEATWSNPQSGARGTAILTTVRGKCSYILHKVYVHGETEPRDLHTEFCQAANGEWLLQP